MRRKLVAYRLGALALLWMSGCAGSQHVQIKFHQLTRGDQYRCTPATKDETCTMIPPVEPASEQKAGTTYFIAPSGCDGSFSQITIEDADSSSPKMHVVCSPVEN